MRQLLLMLLLLLLKPHTRKTVPLVGCLSDVFKGALGDAPKDFLAPKCRLKRRLTGYYCYLILRKNTKIVATKMSDFKA